MIYLNIKPPKQTVSTPVNSEFNMEGFKQTYKRLPKLQREHNVVAAYNAALCAYVTHHGFLTQPYVFANPSRFFCYYNNSVHYNLNKSFRFKNNVQKVFSELLYLPYSTDLQIETNLLQKLEILLKTNNTLSRTEILLCEFQERYHSVFPLNNFFTLDGTLCFWDTNFNPPICDALIYKAIKDVNNDFTKMCLKCSTLLKTLKRSHILLPFSCSKAQNPYYANYKISDQSFSIRYNPEKRAFQTDTLTPASLYDLYKTCIHDNISASHTLNGKNLNHLFHYIKLDTDRTLTPTGKLTHFLYKLTNGNFQNFVNLAILCANIASPEILTSKLFLITYRDINSEFSVSEYFYFILDFIFEINRNFMRFPSINKFVQKQEVPNMINTIFNGTKLLCINKGSASLSDTQIKKLRQYIKGSRVTGTDSKFGSVSFRNTNPIICFSNNQKETTYLEQNLPCIKINLEFIEDIDSLQLPLPNQDLNEYEWLRTCLPIYGLYLLAEKRFHRQPLPKNKKVTPIFSTDAMTNGFLNTCCILSANDFVYTDELYNAYSFYYQTVHKSEPLKRTQFVKFLKQVSGLTYKRPHVSRYESNKYAFTGISLRQNWKECISSSADSLSLEEGAFKEKLQEITDLVIGKLK